MEPEPDGRSAATPGPRRERRESITVSFEARDYLAAESLDPALAVGAKNAIEGCLGVRFGERVLVVVERGLDGIAAALLQSAEAVGAEVIAYVVDPDSARNEAFVTRLCARLAEVEVSILVASVDGLPPVFRRRIISEGGPHRRHGHMVGITEAMMQQSMRADYDEVERLGQALLGRLRPEEPIHVETAMGTSLLVRCDPRHRWHNASGLLRAPGWTNLPGGELVTTPRTVDGVLVPDGGVWLPDGREITRPARLRLRFEDGELVDLDGVAEDVCALTEALDAATHGRRVGQVAFGTNIGVLTSIGSLLQDLKMPGFHLTLGHTCQELTGAAWTSDVEIPLLPRRPDVSVGTEPVLVRGKYARELRG